MNTLERIVNQLKIAEDNHEGRDAAVQTFRELREATESLLAGDTDMDVDKLERLFIWRATNADDERVREILMNAAGKLAGPHRIQSE